MFTDPEQNLNRVHLREGMMVADLGAGVGTYSAIAAKKVGESGKVYAVEVQKDLIQNIKTTAHDSGVADRVDVVWGDIEELGGTKIADRIIDVVIISNVLFQAEDKKGLVSEAKRILKPGGKALIIEWSDSFSGMGPHSEDVVSKVDVKRILNEVGLSVEEEFDTGDHHYGIVCTNA